jgi:small subunit ribosomal protein S18
MVTSQNRDRDFRGGGGDSRGGGGGGDSRGGGGGGRPPTRRFTSRRRRQCVCKEVGTVGYKDVSVLRRFISDRGRIESGRKAGNCAKCQRELGTAISRARFLALLPYAPNHIRVTGSIAPAAAPVSEDEPETDAEVAAGAEANEGTVEAVDGRAETEPEFADVSDEEASDEDKTTVEDTVDESVEATADVELSEGDSGAAASSDSGDSNETRLPDVSSEVDSADDSAEPAESEDSEDSKEAAEEKS